DIPEDDIMTFSTQIKSYGDQNGHLVMTIQVNTEEDFAGTELVVFNLTDGSVVSRERYNESSFATASLSYFIKLHFGTFGGYYLKAIYFLLSLLTCFVIISGVMIWLKARENKMYATKAKFNRNVGAIYLGICLGMYPAVALLFIIAKLVPFTLDDRFAIINGVFFGFWLLYTIYAYVIKDYAKINRHALVLAGAMGISIPVFNGIESGLWFWNALGMGYPYSFAVDVTWLISGVITIMIARAIKPQPATADETPAHSLHENQEVESQPEVMGEPIYAARSN
ncbi:MAG: PepSY-associated TM helix domain-containing protein, partial [Bacteroidota bacterium]